MPSSRRLFSACTAVTHPQFTLRNRQFPRGVSVLEVLISIGVATIGLLGVILLIPLADHQVNRGFVLERANQVGKNAFREFEIMGMNNPANWRLYNTATGTYSALPTSDGVGFTKVENVGGQPIPYRRAFAIDPRFIANFLTGTAAEQAAARAFPYNGVRQMPRLTLPSGLPNSVMGLRQADAVFVSEDDLVFRRPNDDRTLPPIQLDAEGEDWVADPNISPPAGAESRLVRQAQGRFSWMATLVPQEKFGSDSLLGDLYVLSIVVFHQRDGALAMNAENERSVRISYNPPTYNGFVSAGVGGGDVALVAGDTSTMSRSEAETTLDVGAGDWVLLTPIAAGIPTDVGDKWSWYRVVAADSDIHVTTTGDTHAPADSYARFVTLEGPDWPPRETQVTIVKNVVAVFEKTIRLETSSLWTN